MAADESRQLRVDDLQEFRLARLLLLFEVAETSAATKNLDIERLGYYDFLSANPVLVFGKESKQRVTLALEGFDSRSLSYASSSQRFTNRRARLQQDIARLVAQGLVAASVNSGRITYGPTQTGRELAQSLSAYYSRSYRTAARLVLSELRNLSASKLRAKAEEWLRADPLLIPLYEDP
jgi:membrane protease subunit (stomatin/prohibitin family)